MAATSIRMAAVRRLMDLLKAEAGFADVEVEYGLPDERGIGEPWCFVRIADDGATTVTKMRAGRKPREDRFDIELTVAICYGADTESGMQTAEQVEDLFAVVELLVATNPTLALDGNGLDGLTWIAQLGESDGPSVTPVTTGYAAFWNARFTCLSHLY